MNSSVSKVLIVEDEALSALALETYLTGFGYKVVGMAATAAQAIRLAAECQPELVLMDISLRGPADGIEAARATRAMGCQHIFITAHTDSDTRDRAATTDPIGFIGKPIAPEQLRRALKDALSP